MYMLVNAHPVPHVFIEVAVGAELGTIGPLQGDNTEITFSIHVTAESPHSPTTIK
jgi:hypothetical protein